MYLVGPRFDLMTSLFVRTRDGQIGVVFLLVRILYGVNWEDINFITEMERICKYDLVIRYLPHVISFRALIFLIVCSRSCGVHASKDIDFLAKVVRAQEHDFVDP